MFIAVQRENFQDEIRMLDNKSSGVTTSVEKSSFTSDMCLGSPYAPQPESLNHV